MIQQPQYNDVLFLFNDNEHQFLEFYNNRALDTKPVAACSIGGGNAIIRPYQCTTPPRAAGIPTGDKVGYQTLEESQVFIDAAFEYIAALLMTGRYQRVAYSAAEDGRSLGAAIFSPSEEVKQYIVNKIYSLV